MSNIGKKGSPSTASATRLPATPSTKKSPSKGGVEKSHAQREKILAAQQRQSTSKTGETRDIQTRKAQTLPKSVHDKGKEKDKGYTTESEEQITSTPTKQKQREYLDTKGKELRKDVLHELENPKAYPPDPETRAIQLAYLRKQAAAFQKEQTLQRERQKLTGNVTPQNRTTTNTTTTTTTIPGVLDNAPRPGDIPDEAIGNVFGIDLGPNDQDLRDAIAEGRRNGEDEAQRDIQRLTNALDKTQNKLTRKKAELTRLQEEIHKAQEQGETHQINLFNANHQIQLLQSEIDGITERSQRKLQNADSHIKNLMRESEIDRQKLLETNSKIDSLTTELNRAQTIVEDLNTRWRQTTDNAGKEKFQLTNQIEDLKQHLDEAKANVEKSKQDLAKAKAAAHELIGKAFEKGKKEGKTKGLKRGRDEGFSEGRDVGIEAGIKITEPKIYEAHIAGLEKGKEVGEKFGAVKGYRTGFEAGEARAAKKQRTDVEKQRTVATAVTGIGSLAALGTPAANLAVQSFTRDTLLPLAAQYGPAIATETAKTIIGAAPVVAAATVAVGVAAATYHLINWWTITDLTPKDEEL